jgi:glycine cleavage system H protein
VTAVNEELKDAPEKVNADANGTWMLKLTLKDKAELEKLLTAEQYEKFVSEETEH